jgi:hypothetical protein
MYVCGGEIPSVLCGRANTPRDGHANIRHSNRAPGGRRQLWPGSELPAIAVMARRDRNNLFISFFETPGQGWLLKTSSRPQEPLPWVTVAWSSAFREIKVHLLGQQYWDSY